MLMVSGTQKKTCLSPQREIEGHKVGSSIQEEEEDEDEEESGILLFNVTSVQANLSDMYPPAWMRYSLSF